MQPNYAPGLFLRTSAVLAVLLMIPAAAAAANPRLATLQLEIWPEFDRPEALVIVNGELPADVALPAAVTLRLPISSGGASAVATTADPSAGLFNMEYVQKDAGEFITLAFQAPQRHFHVEFYQPLGMQSPDRSFTYVWPGDLAAERVSVIVQEPAAASGLSVTPALEASSIGQNGLRYRSAELGRLDAGKTFAVELRYTKSDPRTSMEILKLRAPAAAPIPDKAGGAAPPWLFALVAGLAVMLAAGGYIIWYGRRASAASHAPRPASARFCSKCGGGAEPEDRFCARCGARLQPASDRKAR
jgi:hypothetical protein